jgi:hypothetical protein
LAIVGGEALLVRRDGLALVAAPMVGGKLIFELRFVLFFVMDDDRWRQSH